MNINADFSVRASAHTASMAWIPSPLAGVQRKMLDRIGGEVARATSIVRYAPGSAFSPHVHTGGEEFLVLDGVFQDEHGDFPCGAYVRNPPHTSHTPGSAPGCTILVKLWQFALDDRTEVRLAAHDYHYVRQDDGTEIMLLHEDSREQVTLEHWPPGSRFDKPIPGGAEIFVLDGSFTEESESREGETFIRHSWLRLPAASRFVAVAGEDGVHVWAKTGHLEEPLGIDVQELNSRNE
ncbi:MAG: cupin [Gammaproteobacteria bacterium]|nr:cupin [Gammaproteobacteria bacterium]